MSLQVWLPFINGNDNQGLNQRHFTNTGATASTSGPLGGSYSFNGSNNQIYGSYTCAEAELSVCLWVTFTKLNVHLIDMRNSDGVGYQPAYVSSSSGIQVGGSNSNWPYINFVPSLNTWYHLAIVYTSAKTQLYVDGEYFGETSSSYATNFDKSLDIHIGSRYSSSNWFGGNVADFRLYNNALTDYEIKQIAQGLLVHYTGHHNPITNYLSDSSGYQRDLISDFSTSESTKIGRYGYGTRIGQTVDDYGYCTSPSSMTKTISFWLKTPKTATTVFFADYKSKLAFGFNSSGYIIPSCSAFTVNMYLPTNLIADTYQFIVIRKNSAGSDVDLFINGVKQTSRSSGNYWTHNTDYLMIGRRSTGTQMDCYFTDFRMYATILSDDDILDLYHTMLKQKSDGTSYPFEIVEGDISNAVSLGKTGQLTSKGQFVESGTKNAFKSNLIISKEFIER